MNKLAIILDSFCGKSKKEVENLDHHFYIPLRIFLDGKEFLEGVDLDNVELLKKMNKTKDIKTSQPTPANFLDTYKKLSQEYENVIVLPTPLPVSGSGNTAMNLAKDFDNVHVVTGLAVGEMYFELSKYLLNNADKDIKELIKFAKKYINETPTFIIPKDVSALLEGGRMGKSLSMIFKKMNIIPIIGLEDEEKLKKKQIKRSGKKAIAYACNKMDEILSDKKDEYTILVTHTLDETFSDIAIKNLKELGYKTQKNLTISIVNAHVGDGAISISAVKKLNN